MEFLSGIFKLTFFIYMFDKGLGALDSSINTWAMDNCFEDKIDLILVADTSVVCSFDKHKPERQMSFFSNLIDVFSPSSETKLNRLRVSLLISSNKNDTPMEVRIKFDDYRSKTKLKDAIRNENIHFEPMSRPMEAIEFINLMTLNETANRARDDAILVIVMFGGHQNINLSYTSDDLRHQMNMSRVNMNVKLFMFAIKERLPERLKLSSNVAVYKVAQIRDELLTTISLLMCNDCYSEWFTSSLETSDTNNSRSISCYKLEFDSEQLSWIEANQKCQKNNSQLASIETDSELLSMSKQIMKKIEDLRNKEKIPNKINVYIGLKRVDSTAGKSFSWINGHPLVHAQWGHYQPTGGSILRCVVWELPELQKYSIYMKENTINDTETSSSQIIRGTWSTVGCGNAISNVYLCETVMDILLNSPPLLKKKFKIKLPSVESIHKAIERGEIGLIPRTNIFMSVASLLRRMKFEDGLSDSYAYANHDISQTVLLNDLKMYYCEGNDGKIPYTSICDYKYDCPYGVDEQYCRKCSFNERECGRQCVPNYVWCDLYTDCNDGSDEKDCNICQHGLCADGTCLLKHHFADGVIDCPGCNSTDGIEYEMNFAYKNNITHCLFTCNRKDCIYNKMLHNQIIDCRGPEGHIDETIGAMNSTVCYTDVDDMTSKFSNWGPQCIYFIDIYGDLLGCRNFKHLLDCDHFNCTEGYYKCPQSYCIPIHYVRDGKFDCPHGEDEDYDMYFLQCPFHFMCQSRSFPRTSLLCLHPDLVCDGRLDCPEGDDELNCNVTCQTGFQCLAGTVVVADYNQVNTSNIPTLIESNTRYLDLTGINISKIFPSFLITRTATLNEVKMSNCSIVNMFMNSAMCSLDTIRRLDLSYNNIIKITFPSLLRCMNNLYYLNLSHNYELILFEKIEYDIKALKSLDLSYTSLSSLSRVTFSFLKDIKYLNLRNTRILDVKFLPTTTIGIIDLRNTMVNDLPYAEMFANVTISSRLYTDSFKLCCPQLHNASTNTSACLSTKDPFSSCSDLMSNMVLRVILWTGGTLAVCVNLAVITYRLFFDRNIFKMAYGHFVTHLSFSDFLMGVYLAVIAAADNVYRDEYVWRELAWRKSVLCKVAGFLSTLSTEVSYIFIFLITLDRYLVIRYPFGQYRISGKTVHLCCAATWITGSIIAMFPLLQVFGYLNVYSTNGMCLGLPLSNNTQSGQEFAIAIFIFFNFFMFTLIAWGQIAIYKTVSAMRMNQSSLTNKNSRRAQDLTIAKNLAIVALTDFLCWFPIGFMGIMVLCGYNIGTEAYAWSAVLILPINSAINPFLYTVPAFIQKLKFSAEKISSDRSK